LKWRLAAVGWWVAGAHGLVQQQQQQQLTTGARMAGTDAHMLLAAALQAAVVPDPLKGVGTQGWRFASLSAACTCDTGRQLRGLIARLPMPLQRAHSYAVD
jgi:hypothetical protein